MGMCECIEKLFCCNFFSWFFLVENLFVARLSFRLFYDHKQFCSRFVAYMEYVPGLKQLLNDVFVKKQSSINLGFLHNCSKKMIDLLDHSVENSTEIVVFVMLTKCCIFCNQNGIVTFVKVVY